MSGRSRVAAADRQPAAPAGVVIGHHRASEGLDVVVRIAAPGRVSVQITRVMRWPMPKRLAGRRVQEGGHLRIASSDG